MIHRDQRFEEFNVFGEFLEETEAADRISLVREVGERHAKPI
jgi:hypothetical protein